MNKLLVRFTSDFSIEKGRVTYKWATGNYAYVVILVDDDDANKGIVHISLQRGVDMGMEESVAYEGPLCEFLDKVTVIG